jgi:hypothetical protein
VQEKTMMKKFRWLASVLFAAAFAAGAQEVVYPPDTSKPNDNRYQPEPTKVGTCRGAGCRLTIRVNGNCDITIDQQWAVITGHNVQLLWEINPGDYVFPEQGGIEFKQDYNPTGEEFYDSRRLSPQVWQVMDSNSMPDVFRYTARVVHKKTGRVCTLDPGVINDWP